MVSFWREPVWLVLLIGGLLSPGCNIFTVFPSEPNTVDALVTDARTALAAGNSSRAIQLLERAFEKDSTDVRVRVELGNALYGEHKLDVFTLRAAAEHLLASSDSSSGLSASRPSRGVEVCTDGAQPDSASERYKHVSTDATPIQRLADRASVVQRVRDLVVRGVLDRRAALFSTASVRVRRKGLLVAAITVMVHEIIKLQRVFRLPERTLFLDREGQPEWALVACAESQDTLTRNREALCTLSDGTSRAIQWLQARNRLSDGNDDKDVFIGGLEDVADAANARTDCS